ncbi:reverse transcriptase domain-containing protein [Tanacetum coccineum]
MRHSYSNEDTCFCVDVIDEVTEEELDALLDESKPFSTTSEKISESSLNYEFKEFMAILIEEIPEQEEEVEDNFEELPLEENLRIKNSIQDLPTDLVTKPLPKHLECAFLEKESLLLVVISSLLKDDEKKRLVFVLKKHKEAFAWKTSNILGISPSFCKHKINFKDDVKLVIQRQHRLNPNMKEVVKKEIIKLLDAGIIYAIKDSPWVSPVHYVPKKEGITVVTNEENELVPTRTVIGWRVCINYHKLNKATRKDHFPLPFMDQMLERLAGNKFFCFLDGFSGYFQIPIEPDDQEKTTFTCPYRTYSYKHMTFGLCNAPATFQRILSSIHQIFSTISHPMTKLLEKDAVFNFNKECIEAFELLKEKLMNAPIMVSSDWSQPFELMCDASDFAFDIVIKNKKGAKNVAADHLLRLENPYLEELKDDDIDDNFPDETLMNISSTEEDKIQCDVFMRPKLKRFSTNVIMALLGDTMVLLPQQRKLLMLVSIGQQSSKRLIL